MLLLHHDLSTALDGLVWPALPPLTVALLLVPVRCPLLPLIARRRCGLQGTVDHFEFTEGLKALGLGLTNSQIEMLISVFDKDNDGEIDYREFVWQVNDGMSDNPAPRLDAIWSAGGAGWVSAAVGEVVTMAPGNKPYGVLATHPEGTIVKVNEPKDKSADAASLTTFRVRTEDRKESTYKGNMLILKPVEIQDLTEDIELEEDEVG